MLKITNCCYYWENTMKNSRFNEEELELLTTCSKWHLITSKEAELPVAKPPGNYLKWLDRNSHTHPFREMFFVLSGEVFYSLNGITYRCIPGTIFLIDANEEHDVFYPPSNRDFKHLWFGIIRNAVIMAPTYSYVNGKEQSGSNGSLTCRSHSGLSFIRKWDTLAEHLEFDNMFSVLEMKYAWGNLITELCQECFRRDAIAATAREQTYQEIINIIVEHIRETAGKNLDWAKLARLAGYSKYHFSRLFKQHTGQTVHDFINTCRNDKVRELTSLKFSQKQIAGELGFSYPSAFSRWYRDNRLGIGKAETEKPASKKQRG